MTKATKWPVRPVKTQISLGIHPFRSEPLLCSLWLAEDPVLLHVDSKVWADWADARLGGCPTVLLHVDSKVWADWADARLGGCPTVLLHVDSKVWADWADARLGGCPTVLLHVDSKVWADWADARLGGCPTVLLHVDSKVWADWADARLGGCPTVLLHVDSKVWADWADARLGGCPTVLLHVDSKVWADWADARLGGCPTVLLHVDSKVWADWADAWLGGCPCWSKSLLGSQVNLLVLLVSGLDVLQQIIAILYSYFALTENSDIIVLFIYGPLTDKKGPYNICNKLTNMHLKSVKIKIFHSHSKKVHPCVMHSSISYLFNLWLFWAKIPWMLPWQPYYWGTQYS